MLKKIIIILFLFLSPCGYKAMYSNENNIKHDFSISKLTFTGDKNLNIRIKTKLNNYTLAEKDKNFILEISSSTKKITVAKNRAGNATSFKNTVKIDVRVQLENNSVKKLQIIQDFTYDSIENQFDLKKYEREIQNNLTETATDKLIIKLSNIK
jgi:hypothetical protein